MDKERRNDSFVFFVKDFIYIYIYECVCVCVCVREGEREINES